MPDYNALKAELAKPAYAGLTDQQAADALNAADPANPVPKPFTASDLLGLLDAAALAKLYARPNLAAFGDDVKAGDLPTVRNWITLATAAGDLSSQQAAALLAVVNATQAGPSKAAQTFGEAVTAAQVNHARSL